MSIFRPWRRNVPREIEEELRFHFDARINELVALGLSAEAARAKALEEFGGALQINPGDSELAQLTEELQRKLQ